MKKELIFLTKIMAIFVAFILVVSVGNVYAEGDVVEPVQLDPEQTEPTQPEDVSGDEESSDEEGGEGEEGSSNEEGDQENNGGEPKVFAAPQAFSVATGPSPKIEICHYPPGNPANPQVLTIDESAWEEKGHSGHDYDFIIRDAQGHKESDCVGIEPDPEPLGDSTLKICKIIVDNEGKIINGSDVNTEFSIGITGPEGYSENVVFNTALNLTHDLVDDNGGDLDAQCYLLEDLAAGKYNYYAEEIGGDGVWGAPRYHDYYQEVPESVSDFYELTVNDGSENDNDEADGEVNVGKGKTRNIVIVNTLVEVPKPEMCNLTLVSNTDDFVLETNNFAKILSFINSGWTAIIPGDAEWIWGDDPVVDSTVETTHTFVSKFNWTGENPVATLDIAADNSYVVELNGSEIDANPGEFNYKSPVNTVSGFPIKDGMNELVISVTNFARPNSLPNSNPAGLLYSLSIDGEGESCGELIPYDPEEPEPTPENSCLIPDMDGIKDLSNIGNAVSGEKDLQEILDDLYGLSVIDKVNDKLQIQKWNCSADELTLDVKFVGAYAGNKAVFGYYTDSNLGTFDPIFRTGNVEASDNDVALATSTGDTFSVNAGDVDSLGFAIKSWTGSTYNVFATENSLNPTGADKVVAYNPAPDTYFLAFDDLLTSHIDYNDLVVEVKAYCENDPEPEYPYGIITNPENDYDVVENDDITGTFTLMAEYYDGDDDNDDAVQWAVRAGTCSAATNTVLGNVDGHPDVAVWDGQNFSFEFDADLLDAGYYCFVFNPTDDGPVDVRETRWFTIEEGDSEPENEKPVITIGDSTLNLYVGDTFTEDATADDTEDGDITGDIDVTGDTVDTGNAGTYTVYYNVKDSKGADADQVTRTVIVSERDDPEPPVVYACSDGIDNDGDGLTDFGEDPGCDSLTDDDEYNRTSSSRSGGRRRSTGGEVLGATTDLSCGMYLYNYMRQDLPNDSYEVLKLQAFLLVQGYQVPVNGVFGPETDAAVRAFQSDLKEGILMPWTTYNLSDGETPTGYVYKTTRYTINNIVCPGSEAFPVLP